MSDVDGGNVKAKASIEYDGSGMKQFKEDLASLPQMVGGLGQSAGQAGSELANLDEGMARNAESAKSFTSAIGELPKMVESGSSTISEMSGVLAEQRSVAEEAASAHETLQKSVESSISSFEKAPTSIQATVEHTQKYAESVQAVSESLVSNASAPSEFAGNMAIFQQAVSDPVPLNTIQEHLNATGQTWTQFALSTMDSNGQWIQEMKSASLETHDALGAMNADVKSTGVNFTESADGAKKFTEQFQGVADSTASASKAINEFGGVGSGMYGPTQAVKDFSSAINEFGGVGEKLYGPMPAMKSVGFGEAFGEVFSGVSGFLNEIAMPLMAVQMIGQVVGQVGQAMYDSAAIAEGPAAHSFGTFTGTVDALGQSLQRATGQFSEGFGQALLPTLNALNNQAASGDLGGLGQFLGGVGATIANLSLITTGIDPTGGIQGLINQGASLLGLQQPFQGPGPTSQAQLQYQQQMAALPQTVQANAQQLQYQSNLTMAEATDPNWLAQNNQNIASQSAAQYLVASYNRSHPIPQSQVIAQAQERTYDAQQLQNYQEQMANPTYAPYDPLGFWGGVGSNIGGYFNHPSFEQAPQRITTGTQAPSGPFDGLFNSVGGFFGGIGKSISDIWNAPKGGADTLGMLFSPQAWGFGGNQAPQTFSGGCFTAGTPVLMADGSEKPIETLRVDERVLAYNGKSQVPATIVACIMFPHKQTYELAFDDGNVLVTTDSHPLAGESGWKSISPESTAQENPGLPVTTLAVGDNIYTADGTLCRLISIQKRNVVPVYNITVGGSHTYYAARILVHNAKAANIGSDGVGNEQVQVSHTFVANVQWEANNLQKQFTGAASWVGQNLSNTFQGAASWVAQGLSNTFQAATTWVAQGLSNTFNGIANWVGQNLSNTFNGVADWVGQNLSNTFNGVASWAAQGLSNTFKGVASWVGSGLEHTFNAVASWTAQNLTPNFTVNPSFTMLAEGTSNWGGGPAIVGEAGPEVVESNGQYSMFDAGASLVNLPPGANVYPMKDLAGSSVAQFANGTGNILPLNIGVKQGGNMPESINVYLNIDGQTFWSTTGMSLAQSVYAGSGNRSY